MKTLTIKMSKWARGGKNGPSGLENGDGNMCCLGFLAKACGVAGSERRCATMPASLLASDRRKMPKKLFDWDCDSQLGIDLAAINDDVHLSDEARKRQLRSFFKEIGYNLRFVK